jgi:tetratricopeptide (TPR) repeat protein
MKKASAVFLLVFIICGIFVKDQALGNTRPDLSLLLDQAKSYTEENPEKAVKLANEALSLLAEDDDPAARSQAYFILGEAYYYMDDLVKAIEQYKLAVETDLLAGNEKTPQHIMLLGNLGYFYDALDQKLVAMDYYQQALSLARELGLKDEIAANLANIGQLKVLQGNYGEAVQYMEEALAIDRETGDESIIATDLNTLGRMYGEWGIYDKAIGYLRESLEIDRRLGRDEKIAIRYNSMGLVYKSWKKFPEALNSFRKALEIDQRLNNAEKVALRKSNIGSTYLAMEQPDKAIEYINSGLEYFIEMNMPSYMASSMIDLGKAYVLKKEYGKAEEILNQSLQITKAEDYKSWRLSSLESLGEIYERSGQFQKALDTFKEYISLKDSLFSIENQKKITEFQAKYDFFAQQQENALLKKDAQLQREKNAVIVLIFSAAALFLVILAMALYLRLRGQQNRRILSEKENENLRLDLELKNNELTYNAMCIIKNNETVAKMVEVVEQALDSGDDAMNLRQIIQRLQTVEANKGWKEFEVRFTHTHKDFYDELLSRFPDLTPNERKLCAFLRLNMSSKDIASITHQSVHSINVARTRMRKKLGIGQTDENLISFLQGL